MTHSMPFSKFKSYVQMYENTNTVYMNTYCLIQIYKTKIKNLLKVADKLLVYNDDLQAIENEEYSSQQLIVGKSMIAILEYIKANYSKFNNEHLVNLADINFNEIAESNVNTISTIKNSEDEDESEKIKVQKFL